MSTSQPIEARCGKCEQPRTVFPPKPEWGEVPSLLCVPCWGLFAEARENGTFVDWIDAFDNATDEEIAKHVAGAS